MKLDIPGYKAVPIDDYGKKVKTSKPKSAHWIARELGTTLNTVLNARKEPAIDFANKGCEVFVVVDLATNEPVGRIRCEFIPADREPSRIYAAAQARLRGWE